MRRKSVNRLKRVIKTDLKAIRNEYKKELLKKDGEKNDWLVDNFYLIEKEGRSVLSSLRNVNAIMVDKSGLPALYSVLFKQLCDGIIPENNKLAAEIIEYNFSLADIELSELFMRAALVSRAAQGVIEKSALLKNTISSFIKVGDMDFEEIYKKCNPTEKLLCKDNIYVNSTNETKSYIRHIISEISLKDKKDEITVAEEAVKLSSENGLSVSEIILRQDIRKNQKKWLYAEIVVPVILSAALGLLTGYYYLILLCFIPLWEISRAFLMFLSTRKIKPKIIPKIKLENGIPNYAQTVILVSSLLPDAQKISLVKNHLKEIYLTNNVGKIKVCLLADLKSAESVMKSSDSVNIEAAKKMTDELNREADGGFMLFIRPRKYSKTQSEYTGYERKRGAITEFVRAVKGDKSGFSVAYGDIEDLENTKYIMALDSDTNLTLDCVTDLVSAAVHPSNHAVIDADTNTVKSGYGIFMPKVEVDTESGYKSSFSRIMAGVSGISVYDTLSGERYQDLFGKSIFTGKGLIDIDAFYKVLNDFFVDETVLSHDILEGEFLNTAFISDAQVTDGFPKSGYSYLARLCRWVRGDWQNIVFLGKKIKTKQGKIKNSLGFVSRFKLFDNLRRSLTPVIAFILILTSVFVFGAGARYMMIFAVLSVIINELFAALFYTLSGGINGLSAVYYGKAVPMALTKILQAALNVIMLPQTAAACGNSIIRAIVRTFITHKNMLEWVTAAQSEKIKSINTMIIKTAPSFLSAVWLFFMSGALGKFIGLFFISDCLISPLISHESKSNKQKIAYLEREKLIGYAAAMWNFFLKYCNEENNYLPPDNVQETPVFRVANRTSPTNIGLMLVSVLAARDFSFIDSKELYDRLKSSMNSIIRLKRWKGNLLNWYDTKTLEPLSPKFVSAVDSGNFLCCLAALKQGLMEYAGEYTPLYEIIKRVDGILKSSDLSAFYNSKRNLLHIGYDMESEELMPSYYDLFMSEARMTSYYAVATRSVPKKHWSALSRTLSRRQRYSGPVSWTGTMFEYFMPYMFLPAPENTMTHEALKYCVFCQRLKAKAYNIPFGISESGFYKFDANMNYQYKAHGVKDLALKRDLNNDLVVSPYSTFLCLPFAYKAALKNIAELERLGLFGECGFYEAADFTKSRTEGQDYSVVKSYMSHHIGMSIMGISNTVKDGIMQTRFMKNSDLLAGKSLLYEKIPVSSVVFKDEDLKETPERPQRMQTMERVFDSISPISPHVTLLSNGEWTTEISDSGTGHSICRSQNITRHSRDILSEPQGVFAVFKKDTVSVPFCAALSCNENQKFRAEFTEKSADFYTNYNGISLRQRVCVHPRASAEIRRFSIKNHTKKELSGDLIIYFEPSLSQEKVENSHRAFQKIFVSGHMNKTNNVVVFTRSLRDNSHPTLCAAGFLDDTEFKYCLSREEALTRPYGVFSLTDSRRNYKELSGKLDVCSLMQIKVKIPPRSHKDFDFFICAEGSVDEIYSRVASLRSENIEAYSFGAPAIFSGDDIGSIVGFSLLPRLFYNTDKTHMQLEALKKNTGNVKDLWSCGLSHDYPILLLNLAGENLQAQAAGVIRLNRKLRYSGIITDAVIMFSSEDEESAKRVIENISEEIIKEYSADIINTAGGIHIIDSARIPISIQNTIIAASAFVFPKSGEELTAAVVPFIKSRIFPPEKAENGDNKAENGVYNIYKKPDLPWSYILANHSFGTLVGDSTLGHSFSVNSRENKLTKWNNDTRYDNRGELLFLRSCGKIYDVLIGASAHFGKETAVYRAVADKISINVTVSVPQKGSKKDIAVEVENLGDEDKKMEICYYTEPVLGESANNAIFIKSSFDGKALELHNPWNSEVKGTMRVSTDSDGAFYTVSKKDFLEGKWDSGGVLPNAFGCAAVGKRIILPPKRKINIKFQLAFARYADSAKYLCENTLPKSEFKNKIVIETPDEELNELFNGFLQNQIINGRIHGRTGFYQCGGAYGFRDQLQDVLSVILTDKALAKRQIARCAGAQFPEGDVLHWWHVLPHNGGKLKGVRTRYSDDLLWLPYVLAEYVLETGDTDILYTETYFVMGELLNSNEHEKYFEVEKGTEKASILEHAQRAIKKALNFGEHSLLLIGGGDWNDGYNRVGINGRGESVWLSQFAAMVLEKMYAVLQIVGDSDMANEYLTIAKKLKSAVDEFAWDGDRYLRAFYDDGTKMGSVQSNECKIDSLSQSFAALSDMPDKARVRKALKTAYDNLVDKENGVVKLFSPAFSGRDKRAGYVASYPEGFRENGGQYTHAAVWFCMALFKEGLKQEGQAVLEILNPLKKYKDEQLAQKYKTEPYYMCGDVYSAKGFEGRGGWSLYTGSAGWYYSLVLNEILGIRQFDAKLHVAPDLPENWQGYKAKLYLDGTQISINVFSNNPKSVTVDGKPGEFIPLDNCDHTVNLQ